jgi:hypothetical protein
MYNESEIKKSKASASGRFQGVQIVAGYMKDRFSLIEGVLEKPETSDRESCLKGLWTRAYAWMQSLAKLNGPLDFQPVSVGNRALLEIAVDMILLHHDKTNESGWKMRSWGESERMKAAQQIVNFYKEEGIPIPDVFKTVKNFFDKEQLNVDSKRKTLWPCKDRSKSAHPNRWTGNSEFSKDVEKADQLYCKVVKAELGFTLTEYYKTQYRRICWLVHSGVAGIWGIPPEAINLTCGLANKWSADFGMLCTKIILIDFGFDVVLQGLEKEWKQIKVQRDIVYRQETGNL